MAAIPKKLKKLLKFKISFYFRVFKYSNNKQLPQLRQIYLCLVLLKSFSFFFIQNVLVLMSKGAFINDVTQMGGWVIG